jgi:hypothetical protein
MLQRLNGQCHAEDFMTYDLSDEALEAAARLDGGRAITVGYCATAASAWYCLPF